MTQIQALFHTFDSADVTVQLRPAAPRLVTVAEKEALLRQGLSYGMLLTPETRPSTVQMVAYHDALTRNGPRVATLIAALTAHLLDNISRPVLVSLARAGTPVGCAMTRFARRRGQGLPHHTLSIIRGSGIDQEALKRVQHVHPGATLIFVDGWTGKGSIADTLSSSLPAGVPPLLAVLSDPAGVASFAATHDDLLLPHAALNATISGLMSRTFVDAASERGGELHGVRTEEHLRPDDVTGEYLAALDALDTGENPPLDPGPRPVRPYDTVLALAAGLGITDPHLVKPGVGEATRVFLRRQPAGLLLRDAVHPDILHLKEMAEMADIPVTVHAELPYLAAALIDPRTGEAT
ncbi:cysteine protease StiP domain-containing protein [Deinococcus arenicola]|uniref:Tellurite-like stress resistance cysteine protease StiP n=1 Tax=Deinococcus arenicola TaxID=2994950 RepID=A0ABU4DS68_9DEIO|nr:cysteine protease StiP domain-containing protein [Deinococcus sp. ZS9-10]MDV6375271.1 tellurite-like stress resistance cysteine protease StiP [Deinococcus sp. ZS9-10]